MDTNRSSLQENPMPKSSVFSQLFFSWLDPLFRVGYKRPLGVEDMYQVCSDDDATFLTDQLQSAWEKELQRTARFNKKPSFLRAIWITVWLPVLKCTIVATFMEALRVVQPILIGLLTLYFTPMPAVTTLQASLLALGIFLLTCLSIILRNNYYFDVALVGMRIRVASCGLLYRKALKLTTSALGHTTTGQIVTLMSSDVTKFDKALVCFPYLVIAPVQAIAVLAVLWQFIGPSCLVGLIILLLFVPVQGVMGKVFSILRFKQAKQTDTRVHLMDELLAGMKIIKMYCWEKPFSDMVASFRRQELKVAWTTMKAALITLVPSFSAHHFFVSMTIIAATLLADAPLTSEFIYTLTLLASNMMWSMTSSFPLAIMLGSQGVASSARIQKFLELDEVTLLPQVQAHVNGTSLTPLSKTTDCDRDQVDIEVKVPLLHNDLHSVTEVDTLASQRDQVSIHIELSQKNASLEEAKLQGSVQEVEVFDIEGVSNVSVSLSDVSAHWPSQDTDRLALTDITLAVKSGELVAVVGPVGAGKSSLLMAILNEVPIVKGTQIVRGKLAYVSQQAWIFSASLRQNILFGLPFDELKYKKVLELCDLEKDISLLPYKDLSLVGERGVNLSRGQRARVSLARALYHEAQIYLLDDPLSAVDAVVGKHLFDRCIKDYLSNCAVILVTHQLQYLEQVSRIVVLEDSRQLAVGTFQELTVSGIDFTELLKCYDDQENPKKPFHERTEDVNNKGSQTMLQLNSDIISNGDTALSKICSRPASSESSLLNKADTAKPLESRSYVNTKSGDPDSSANFAPGDELFHSVHSLHNADIMPSKWNTDSLLRDTTQDGQEEHREEGQISTNVYKEYIFAGANGFLLIFVFTVFILGQVFFALVDWWISRWSNMEEPHRASANQSAVAAASNETDSALTSSAVGLNNVTEFFDSFSGLHGRELRNFNVYVLLGLLSGLVLFSALRALLLFKVCIRASQRLHDRMFHTIVRSKMHFFDTNPVGRILNRFSKDIGLLDEQLPSTIYEFFKCLLASLCMVIVCIVINPYTLILTVPLMVVIIFITRYYVATSRSVKRLEGTTNSPVFSHISATLTGLYTVRAFAAQKIFISEFASHQNLHTVSSFLFFSTNRWLAVRLDWICAIFVTGVMVAGIFAKDSLGLSAGSLGLTITYAMYLMGLFQWMIRQCTEVENMMTAVERVLEYCNIPSEAALETHCKPPVDWPDKGAISIAAASMRYSEVSPFVLKDITLDIKPAEKIGIVGRTGAGKSSLLTALFRICEPTGSILIDGVDITSLGLHDLRRKISIIPQDPVLFSGTVRYNLDPFAQYLDEDIWDALTQVQLRLHISSLPEGGLQARVDSAGSNFSVGQRQLLCLARAILGKNKVLVMDEATANVDTRTDALIQQTIRENFRSCTVLTIAHRLHTIMDSDRVLVLDEGRVREFAPPDELMSNERSWLYKMAATTGSASLHELKKIAHSACNNGALNQGMKDGMD